jgi:hypothetical protein
MVSIDYFTLNASQEEIQTVKSVQIKSKKKVRIERETKWGVMQGTS